VGGRPSSELELWDTFLTFWAHFILSPHGIEGGEDLKTKHKITAAILTLLAAVSVWQAFAQTDCRAACKAKYEACMKKAEKLAPDDKFGEQMACMHDERVCLKACIAAGH
jgi:hypothetical protein